MGCFSSSSNSTINNTIERQEQPHENFINVEDVFIPASSNRDMKNKFKLVLSTSALLCISTVTLDKVCQEFDLYIPRIVIQDLFALSRSKDGTTKQKAVLMRHWLLTKNINGNTVVIVQNKNDLTTKHNRYQPLETVNETFNYIQWLSHQEQECSIIAVTDDDLLSTKLADAQFPRANIWTLNNLLEHSVTNS